MIKTTPDIDTSLISSLIYECVDVILVPDEETKDLVTTLLLLRDWKAEVRVFNHDRLETFVRYYTVEGYVLSTVGSEIVLLKA